MTPARSVLLFARVHPLGVAWLRVASAAAVYAAWRRPWRRLVELDGEGWRLLLAMGAVLAVMNACFYLAIDRVPLGTVAAIEFLPVIALAAAGARTIRNAIAPARAGGRHRRPRRGDARRRRRRDAARRLERRRCVDGSGLACRRCRRGHLLVRHPVRVRPARDGTSRALDVRAARVAATGDGDRDRRDRARAAPVARRRRRRRTRRRR